MFLSSLLFFFSVSRSFHYFFFLLARSVHSLPLIHVPFLGFLLYCTLLIISINLLVVFPFISSPLPLSLLLKMMPLIKWMVRSSHSASPATTYSCFPFFLFFSSTLIFFQSISIPLVAACGHSAPCCPSHIQSLFISRLNTSHHYSNDLHI